MSPVRHYEIAIGEHTRQVNVTRLADGRFRVELDGVVHTIELPGGYHRDVQLTEAPLLRGVRAAREALRVATRLAAVVEPTPRPLDPALFAAAEAYRRDKPFREAYQDVAAELAANTFVAEPTPPPSWSPEVFRSRLVTPSRPDRWIAWRSLFA